MINLIRMLAVLFFFTGVLPMMTGVILFDRKRSRMERPDPFIFGQLILTGAFELVCVPMAVLHQPLHRVTLLWLLLIAGLIFIRLLKKKKAGLPIIRSTIKKQVPRPDGITLLLLIGLAGLVLAACCFYLFGMHIDDDDARYVANAVAAYETDTIYHFHPNTGEVMTYFVGEVSKDLVSTVMIYYAAVSRLAGVSAVILIHSFWPVYWLLFSVLIYRMIAVRIYTGEKERLYFQLCCMLIQCMGNVTVFTGSSFTLLRLWQGKALIPAVIVPSGICLLLELWKNGSEGLWPKMALLNVFACFCSGNGIYLSAILTGVLCLSALVREKTPKPLPGALAACIPNLVCTCIYILADRMVLR